MMYVIFLTDLQGSITRIHRTIDLMYSDKSMMQVGTGYKNNHPSCAPFIFLHFSFYFYVCRFLIGSMQCWSMKARPVQVTTGRTSMTPISAAG